MHKDTNQMTTITQELHNFGLLEAAQLVQTRQVSSVELTEAMLHRISSLNPKLHAFVQVMTEAALESANAADRDIANGRLQSPIHGVPLAIKDIFWTKGFPTSAGMRIHKDFVAETDATAVSRLRNAGGVLLGKLTLTEGVYAEHRPPFEAPINPWNSNYWSGASSSGSGVSVASCLCYGALASETGGSIKLPSAANGVTGIKPTWGRVSRHGVFELAATLDHVGAIARNAADTAAILSVIAGPDPLDPTASQLPVPPYLDNLNKGVRNLRIGIDPAWMVNDVDAVTSGALEGAVEVLCAQGAQRKSVKLPDPTKMIWDWFGLCAVQTALAHKRTYPERQQEYGPALTDLLKIGHSLSGLEYQELLLRREKFRGEMNEIFEHVDLLALPVLSFPTPTLQRMTNIDDDLIAGLHRYTCPFNMSGHPGIVMPCGFTTQRTPIAFQLVGPHFSEDRLFSAAHEFQKNTDWHNLHPVI